MRLRHPFEGDDQVSDGFRPIEPFEVFPQRVKMNLSFRT